MADSQTPQTYHVWKQAWQAFVDLKRPILVVILLFIAIPQILSEWFLATEYQSYLNRIAADTDALTIIDLIQTLSSGMFLLIGVLFGNFLLFGMAYILIVRYAFQHLQSKPPMKLSEHLLPALKKFPKSIVLLLLIFFLYILIQSTLPPLILILAPIIMAPIILIVESKSLFKSIGDTASLRFLRKSKLPKISVYFILLGYIGFLILTLYVGVWFSEMFLNLDVWLPLGFGFINHSILNLPFSGAHLIFELFFVALLSLAMSYFILLKVSFYYFIIVENKRLPAGGLQI